MWKNLIGSLVFTVAVFVVINFIGDSLVPQTVLFQQASYETQNMTEMTSSMDKKAGSNAQKTPEASQPVATAVTPKPAIPTSVPAEKILVPGDAASVSGDAASVSGDAASVSGDAASVSGDAALGQKLFKRKCAGCHTAKKGGRTRVGPNLWAIVGRPIASVSGFRYSKALKAVGGAWNETQLERWLTKPRTMVPGTKMGFSGLKKKQDRANLVAYLGTLKG